MGIELSIIVPVYNVEQYLEVCLDSIYTIENIKKEVILVNDGSTDSSLKILKRYKNKYPDITVLIDKKNGGLSSARNAGIVIAKGEYISFIDSDDWIDGKRYEEFFKEGQKYDLDIMVSSPIIYEKDKKIVRNDFINLNKEKIYQGKEFLKNCHKINVYGVEVWDDIFKKKFLLENKIFFENGLLHEDELFTPSAQLKANRIKVIDIKFYYYRQRSGSITKSRDKLNEISCIYIFTKLLFNKELNEGILRKRYFWEYQRSFSKLNILYIKEYFKLLFLSNLTFQDRVWLLKVLKYVKEVKWSIKNEIK